MSAYEYIYIYIYVFDDTVKAQVIKALGIITVRFSLLVTVRRKKHNECLSITREHKAYSMLLALNYVSYEWTTMNNVNSAGRDPINTDGPRRFKPLLQSIRVRGRRWEVKARERVNVLLMNRLDAERSAEPKETLMVFFGRGVKCHMGMFCSWKCAWIQNEFSSCLPVFSVPVCFTAFSQWTWCGALCLLLFYPKK